MPPCLFHTEHLHFMKPALTDMRLPVGDTGSAFRSSWLEETCVIESPSISWSIACMMVRKLATERWTRYGTRWHGISHPSVTIPVTVRFAHKRQIFTLASFLTWFIVVHVLSVRANFLLTILSILCHPLACLLLWPRVSYLVKWPRSLYTQIYNPQTRFNISTPISEFKQKSSLGSINYLQLRRCPYAHPRQSTFAFAGLPEIGQRRFLYPGRQKSILVTIHEYWMRLLKQRTQVNVVWIRLILLSLVMLSS